MHVWHFSLLYVVRAEMGRQVSQVIFRGDRFGITMGAFMNRPEEGRLTVPMLRNLD